MKGKFAIFLILLVFAMQKPLWGQINFDDEFPKYYIETEDYFERLKELPRDTVRDTIYINYFEDYIKTYVGQDVSLTEMLRNFDSFQRMIDSIGKLDPEAYKLFYHFILPRDSVDAVSSAFVVSQMYLDHTEGKPVIRKPAPGEGPEEDWEKTMVFHLGNRIEVGDFLRDTALMKMSLLYIFKELSTVKELQSLMIVIPDYNFELKRALVQYVKSVRLLLDASRDFKFETKTRLDIVLQKPDDVKQHSDLLYALALEVTDLGLLDRKYVQQLYEGGNRSGEINNKPEKTEFFVPITIINRDSLTPGFIDQLKSHYYIARYFPSNWDVRQADLTELNPEMASLLMAADYQENYWEIYFFTLIGIITIMLALLVLYYTHLTFSMFINNNLESVALISIVLLLEIVAVVINMFQYMCEEDTFTLFAKNPILIFTFPLVVVAIVPILQTLSKRRRIPNQPTMRV